MNELNTKRCEPCEGGIDPLSAEQCAPYLEMIPKWAIVETIRIEREFELKDFSQALKLINSIGVVAEDEGHHPDMLVYSWNKVKVTLWTHAIGGLSINDFIVASKIDRLPEVPEAK